MGHIWVLISEPHCVMRPWRRQVESWPTRTSSNCAPSPLFFCNKSCRRGKLHTAQPVEPSVMMTLKEKKVSYCFSPLPTNRPTHFPRMLKKFFYCSTFFSFTLAGRERRRKRQKKWIMRFLIFFPAPEAKKKSLLKVVRIDLFLCLWSFFR